MVDAGEILPDLALAHEVDLTHDDAAATRQARQHPPNHCFGAQVLQGRVGELAGPGLGLLWPLLWQGQWVHAGKGTTFGLGAYRLMAPAVAP